MPGTNPTMAERVAKAASEFQRQRVGTPPKAVTVVLSKDTLVITMHGALTPAEQALAASPAGAAQVQEFHRQLFAANGESLRREIERITGMKIHEAAAEIETSTKTVIHAFTNGTMVQVYLLAQPVTDVVWNTQMEPEPDPDPDPEPEPDPDSEPALAATM